MAIEGLLPTIIEVVLPHVDLIAEWDSDGDSLVIPAHLSELLIGNLRRRAIFVDRLPQLLASAVFTLVESSWDKDIVRCYKLWLSDGLYYDWFLDNGLLNDRLFNGGLLKNGLLNDGLLNDGLLNDGLLISWLVIDSHLKNRLNDVVDGFSSGLLNSLDLKVFTDLINGSLSGLLDSLDFEVFTDLLNGSLSGLFDHLGLEVRVELLDNLFGNFNHFLLLGVIIVIITVAAATCGAAFELDGVSEGDDGGEGKCLEHSDLDCCKFKFFD